jgi:phytoene desaturase
VAEKHIVVIGAGVGGIYTAARLAKHGYRVTVCEKNSRPGGRCSHLERDGHSFDTGPTLLMMPDIFTRAFADLGELLTNHLDLQRLDPTYHVHFHDSAALTVTADQTRMRAQLEAIEPHSFKAFQRYLEEGRFFHKLAMPNFIDRDFRSVFDYFTPKNLYLALRLKVFRKHYNYMGRFFRDPKLKEAFTFRDAYLGLNPFEASAMFALLQYLELADGVWLPKGGMYSIVTELVKVAERLGVHFVYNTPVNRLNVAKDRVSGVTVANGEQLRADIVVANADLTYVYQRLLPISRMAHSLLRKEYTCSAITFYWGTDRQYPQLGVHNLFVSGEYQRSFRQVVKDLTLPNDPSFYLHTPVPADPNRAPKGHDSLMAVVPVGHMHDTTPQNWPRLRNQARRLVFKRLAAIGLTDLPKRIKFEVSYTAEDWAQLYNLTKGATLGLNHNLRQMGYLRPRNRHQRFHNLYFTGASTHPGSGVPTVLISARLTSERILRENG